MGFYRVNNIVTHFRLEGREDAPLLVFVNALGSDLRIWDEVAALLSKNWRLLRYDLRGHGLSSEGGAFPAIEDYADDLAALLEQIRINLGIKRAGVVGLSMGGLIAQQFYHRYADRCAALVLCGTSDKIGDAESWEARIQQIGQGGIESLADGVLQRWFTKAFHQTRADELQGWRAMLARTPESAYIKACRALQKADLRDLTKSIMAPVVCVGAQEDGSIPPLSVEALAQAIPHAEFVLLANAAHMMGLEQPKNLAEIIDAHMRKALFYESFLA